MQTVGGFLGTQQSPVVDISSPTSKSRKLLDKIDTQQHFNPLHLSNKSLTNKFASKWKKIGDEKTKSKYLLNMNPPSGGAPHGIPIRALMQMVFRYKRDKVVKEFLLYFVYAAIFVAVVLSVIDTRSIYSTYAVVADLVLDEEFISKGYTSVDEEGNEFLEISNQFKKNFPEIGSFAEISDWLTGPLLSNVYQSDWYNGDSYTNMESGYLNQYLRLIGGVRIVQYRVHNRSCFDRENPSERYRPRLEAYRGDPITSAACYGKFSRGSTESREDFGPNGIFKYKDNLLDTGAEGLSNWGISNYGNNGFPIYLPVDKDAASVILSEALEQKFLDQATRALLVEFSLYNEETRLITVSRFLVELLPTGQFIPSSKIFSFQLSYYSKGSDYIRLVGEVIILIGCLYYLSVEVKQLATADVVKRYFSDLSNIFELCLQVLVICSIVFWFQMQSEVLSVRNSVQTVCDLNYIHDPVRFDEVVNEYGLEMGLSQLKLPQDFLSFFQDNSASPFGDLNIFTGNRPCFRELYGSGRTFLYFSTFCGFILFLMFLKFFKFFTISRRMSAIWITIAHASKSLIAFLIGFCLLIVGFACLGMLCYGGIIPSFRSFESSFSTLIRMPLGDFDYQALSAARPDVTPFFFAAFMALIYLVSMNMLVGIISVAFETVNARLVIEEKWMGAGDGFEHFLLSKIVNFFRRILSVRKYFLLFYYYVRGLNVLDAPSSSNGTNNTSSRKLNQSISEVLDDSRSVDDAILQRGEEYLLTTASRWIEAVEQVSQLDLTRYFEDIINAATDRNVYIGINELCSLSRDLNDTDPFCQSRHLEDRRGQKIDFGEQGDIKRSFPCCCFSRKSRKNSQPETRTVNSGSGTSNGSGSGSHGKDDGSSDEDNRQDPNTTTRHFTRFSVAAGGVRNIERVVRSPEELRALHGHRCVAWQLLHAYYAYRDVTCLGSTERHQFWGDVGLQTQSSSDSIVNTNLRGKWAISMLSKYNYTRSRIVTLEEERDSCFFILRDPRHRIVKKIPLDYLCQTEASLTHVSRCCLVFETPALDSDTWRSHLSIKKDTRYYLTFGSQTERDQFLALTAETRVSMLKSQEHERNRSDNTVDDGGVNDPHISFASTSANDPENVHPPAGPLNTGSDSNVAGPKFSTLVSSTTLNRLRGMGTSAPSTGMEGSSSPVVPLSQAVALHRVVEPELYSSPSVGFENASTQKNPVGVLTSDVLRISSPSQRLQRLQRTNPDDLSPVLSPKHASITHINPLSATLVHPVDRPFDFDNDDAASVNSLDDDHARSLLFNSTLSEYTSGLGNTTESMKVMSPLSSTITIRKKHKVRAHSVGNQSDLEAGGERQPAHHHVGVPSSPFSPTSPRNNNSLSGIKQINLADFGTATSTPKTPSTPIPIDEYVKGLAASLNPPLSASSVAENARYVHNNVGRENRDQVSDSPMSRKIIKIDDSKELLSTRANPLSPASLSSAAPMSSHYDSSGEESQRKIYISPRKDTEVNHVLTVPALNQSVSSGQQTSMVSTLGSDILRDDKTQDTFATTPVFLTGHRQEPHSSSLDSDEQAVRSNQPGEMSGLGRSSKGWSKVSKIVSTTSSATANPLLGRVSDNKAPIGAASIPRSSKNDTKEEDKVKSSDTIHNFDTVLDMSSIPPPPALKSPPRDVLRSKNTHRSSSKPKQ